MKIEDKEYQILKLTDLFYKTYPNPPYKEILKKQQRAYTCLLYSIQDYYICIPFRTEISHKYAYKFKYSERAKQHKSGLDYTKMVIIKNIKFLDNQSVIIDKDEFKETIKNIHIIKKHSFEFLQDYINHMLGKDLLDKEEFKRRYQYSPLKYFHKELGMDNILR